VEDDCRNARFQDVADSLAVTTYYGGRRQSRSRHWNRWRQTLSRAASNAGRRHPCWARISWLPVKGWQRTPPNANEAGGALRKKREQFRWLVLPCRQTLAATIQGCLVFLNNDLRAIVAASHSDKRKRSAVVVWKALSIDGQLDGWATTPI
jgi:hypothetical protein